jgi:hypothetical protein
MAMPSLRSFPALLLRPNIRAPTFPAVFFNNPLATGHDGKRVDV